MTAYNAYITQSYFPTVPAACALYPGTPGIKVTAEIPYMVGGKRRYMPADFWCNGGSIPAPLWPIITSPFDPRYVKAFGQHDWGYTCKVDSREANDDMLFDELIIAGMSQAKAISIHAAVRSFGWMAWRDTPEDRLYVQLLRNQIEADGRPVERYFLKS